MPLLTLHLVKLAPSTALSTFLAALQAESDVHIVLASTPEHVIVAPTNLDKPYLLGHSWDILLLLHTPGAALPANTQSAVDAEYKVCCGVPSALLSTYPERNHTLRSQSPPNSTPDLDAALHAGDLPGGERLEMSKDLVQFMSKLEARRGTACPVTMLNLLHFHPGRKQSYFKYGQAFKDVAGKRGGDAKLVGNVVPPPRGQRDSRNMDTKTDGWWDEMSLVHYPSIRSFCDMLSGSDYQEINERYRLGSLKDTFLLCTTETLNLNLRETSRL